MSAENERLVTDFCIGLQTEFAKTFDRLAEDVDYLNVPMKPVKGREASRKFLEPFAPCLRKMAILHTTSHGHVVMNERLETWVDGEIAVDLPVAGVFEIRDGKIAKWRDYFDLPTIAPLLEAVAKRGS
jgi:limonene-1,2-epoxide hydrolase